MTANPELLPCPFCGSSDIDPKGLASFKPEYHHDTTLTWDKDATPEKIEHRPACNNCSAATYGDWKTRTEAPQRDLKFRAVEHHGDAGIDARGKGYILNEHWIVNGKKFYHNPTDKEVEEAYEAPTATPALTERIEGLRKRGHLTGDELQDPQSKAWNAALDAVLELSKAGGE